jgi:hypothetical protein
MANEEGNSAVLASSFPGPPAPGEVTSFVYCSGCLTAPQQSQGTARHHLCHPMLLHWLDQMSLNSGLLQPQSRPIAASPLARSALVRVKRSLPCGVAHEGQQQTVCGTAGPMLQ